MSELTSGRIGQIETRSYPGVPTEQIRLITRYSESTDSAITDASSSTTLLRILSEL